MPYELKDRIRRAHFTSRCKDVLRVAPVTFDPTSVAVVVSQLRHKDLLMFLLAVKSFSKRVKLRAVSLIDDGSLTAKDVALLREHVPGITVFDLSKFRTAACPTGGTWERLLAIAALVAEHYVIQLDSDTLTLGAVAEVCAAAASSQAFVLGTWDNQKVETAQARYRAARKLVEGATNTHVQVLAEANLDKLQGFESMNYVRGCSGFVGFPRRSFTREMVETYSKQMRNAIGDQWDAWGSEQFMSNVVVANIRGVVVLPHPKYADCHKMQSGVTEFIHFIGGCRFDGGKYAKLGEQMLASL